MIQAAPDPAAVTGVTEQLREFFVDGDSLGAEVTAPTDAVLAAAIANIVNSHGTALVYERPSAGRPFYFVHHAGDPAAAAFLAAVLPPDRAA